jgi:uncharacterized protein (UPF0332 family)
MLEVSAVDLVGLAEALEDHTYEHTWWFDPRTGQVELSVDAAGVPASLLDTENLIPVDPTPPRALLRDMEEFLAGVTNPRAQDRLTRALSGRDPQRFRDVVCGFPGLRERWRRFADERRQRRAVEWLVAEGVISAVAADEALARLVRPGFGPASGRARQRRPAVDARLLAHRIGVELADVYGDRLRDVVLVGSRARGQAHPESDVDLLVILDQVTSHWAELDRMDDILWRHSYENGVIVTAVPVAEQDMREFRLPWVVRERGPVAQPVAGLAAEPLDAPANRLLPPSDDESLPAPAPEESAVKELVEPAADRAGLVDQGLVEEHARLLDSHEELAAARLLAAAGHPRQAISRAYSAALFAAHDALLLCGETRSKHAHVLATFCRLVVRGGGLDPSVGRLVRSLYERRDAVDEARQPAPPAEAERAIRDAEDVVAAIETWVKDHSSGLA